MTTLRPRSGARDPWADADTVIGVEHDTGRTHTVCHLDRLRIRYFAQRLRPARPTEFSAAQDAPGEFAAATDFADL